MIQPSPAITVSARDAKGEDAPVLRVIEHPRPDGSLQSLQVGRGLAAVAVLLYHANLIIGLPKYYGVQPAEILIAGKAGVEYFFVLSGFVMVIAHWRDLHGEADMAGFIWKRFRRVYPLLWAVLLPLMLLVSLDPSYSPANEVGVMDYLSALAIAPVLDLPVEPFLIVEWSLRYEILFYTLFLVLLHSRAAFIIMSLPVLTAGVFSLSGTSLAGVECFATPYFLLFFMGMAGGWAFKRWSVATPGGVIAAGLALLGICVWQASSGSFSHILVSGFGVASTLIVTGAAWAERGRPPQSKSMLALLGDASYSIYLVHYPVLSIATKIAVRVTDSPDLAFVMASGVALLGGIGCHLVVERPLLRLLPNRLPGDAARV